MIVPIPYYSPYSYRTTGTEDERVFPIIPFLTGLVVAPFLYGAFHQGNYYPYPPPPPYYYPYGYYGHHPYHHKGYY